jgi:hypothetical protein
MTRMLLCYSRCSEVFEQPQSTSQSDCILSSTAWCTSSAFRSQPEDWQGNSSAMCKCVRRHARCHVQVRQEACQVPCASASGGMPGAMCKCVRRHARCHEAPTAYHHFLEATNWTVQRLASAPPCSPPPAVASRTAASNVAAGPARQLCMWGKHV